MSRDGTVSKVTYAAKVAFLSDPASYAEGTIQVRVIETSHACVFLTDEYAYKLKKEFRHGQFDFSSLERREHLCNEEYRLNLALARNTYLGVEPLVLTGTGQLAIDGEGTPVEWLVKMRRLPAGQFLDVAAANDALCEEDVFLLMQKITRFYGEAQICGREGPSYPERLRRALTAVSKDLLKAPFAGNDAADIVDRLSEYVDVNSESLEERRRRGRLKEIHGDLRPEHVCLMPGGEPEIIDRLEFDADLRCLDCVEEIAYFGLECRAIGQGWIADRCIEWYQANGRDPVPKHLWHFYGARRAVTRAMLCAWHAMDGKPSRRWSRRGQEYLGFALQYLDSGNIG